MSARETPPSSALTPLVFLGRGLALTALAVWEALVVLWLALSVTLVVVGVGVLMVPGALAGVRSDARRQRRLALGWSGVRVAERYGPVGLEGVQQTGLAVSWRRVHTMLGDRATWKDLLWHVVNPFMGPLMACAPAVAVVHGVWGIVLLWLWEPVVRSWDHSWYLFLPLNGQGTAVAAAVLGVLEIIAGLLIARPLVRLHGRWVAAMLSGVSTAELQHRVDHLSESRSDAVSHQAEELRRIERDLHDGAQARLVAMGMTLGAAEKLIDENPQAAREMVREAKQTSSEALRELRDLVRGIHPPVLADRGLVDAIRARALESPLRVQVRSTVHGRPLPPLESAVYFAVSEILTNVAKHADAHEVSIDVSNDDGHLRVSVQDDGKGGADPDGGTGLRGSSDGWAPSTGSSWCTAPPGDPPRSASPSPAGSPPSPPSEAPTARSNPSGDAGGRRRCRSPRDLVEEGPGRRGALVDEGLDVVRERLLDEGGGAGDPDAGQQVVRSDAAAGRALGAQRHPAGVEDGGEQPGQRCRVRQVELVGTTGQGEPARLPGQPQADVRPDRDRGGRHGERLGAALGGVRAGSDLHHEGTRHDRHRSGTAEDPDTIGCVIALEIVYTSILVATAVAITWFAGFVVLRLYRGQR